jgi:cell wall-associated NlpC family hydrolase
MLAGCATTLPSQNHTATGIHLATKIKSLLGSRYKFGGNSPRGFDCSGLIQYAHKELGINIPRTTRSQLKQSRPVRLTLIQPGDVLFFRQRVAVLDKELIPPWLNSTPLSDNY